MEKIDHVKRDHTEEQREYPDYYYVIKDELLGFLPNEDAKKAFMFSLGSWFTK